MRWTRECRPNALMRTVKPCGPVPSTLGSSLVEDDRRGDGGYQARDTGESTEQPFHHCAGSAGSFRLTCSDFARTLFVLRARLRVRPAPGIPCALCFRGTPKMHHPDA